jgi:hypothetical protein
MLGLIDWKKYAQTAQSALGVSAFFFLIFIVVIVNFIAEVWFFFQICDMNCYKKVVIVRLEFVRVFLSNFCDLWQIWLRHENWKPSSFKLQNFIE